MFRVGVLVVELRHHPRLPQRETQEADGYQETPTSAENEGPANGLDAIELWNDHLLHDGWRCAIVQSLLHHLAVGGAHLVSH